MRFTVDDAQESPFQLHVCVKRGFLEAATHFVDGFDVLDGGEGDFVRGDADRRAWRECLVGALVFKAVNWKGVGERGIPYFSWRACM